MTKARKAQNSLILLAIALLLLPLEVQSQTLALYEEKIDYIPGGTYDLGTLSATNVLKVSMNWVMVTSSVIKPTFGLYKIIGSSSQAITVDQNLVDYPTTTSLLYQQPIGSSARFYLAVETATAAFTLFDYNI